MSNPTSLSKSMQKAMGCQRYFALSYLAKDPALAAGSSNLADIGTEFHEYRAIYIQHLQQTGRHFDEEWIRARLASLPYCAESLDLIEYDIPRFVIDPTSVIGTEVYLSVDEQFEPLDFEPGTVPHGRKQNPNSYAHGTLDLILLEESTVVVRDYKSGFSSNVSDYEASHNALLALIHFPFAEFVRFEYEFIRSGAAKVHRYHRDDIPALQRVVRSAHAKMLAIRDDVDALEVNPFAGLCCYCNLTCPVKQAVLRGVAALPAVQTADDAISVATTLQVADSVASSARSLLKNYLTEHGRLELPDGSIAEVIADARSEYPLTEALKLLGVDVPEKSVKWDVPLSGLTIGSTKLHSYADTKKRSGLRSELATVAKLKPYHEIKIRKPTRTEEQNLVPLLAGSIEQCQQNKN